MRNPKDPRSREEWQEAANIADFWLQVDSAKKYGLLRGGPDVDVDRCDEILDRAKRIGIRPDPNAVKAIIHKLAKHAS